MTHNMALALLVILGAVFHANAMEFNCSTLLPAGMTAKDSLKKTAFQIEVVDDKRLPTSTFKAGGKLTVIVKGDLPIDTFVLQARAPLGDNPIGRWQTKDFKQTTFSCRGGAADTVTNAEKVEVQKVEAMWMAPENLDVNEVEFVASVKNADGKFWYDFHSVLVEIDATPTPTPKADEEGEEQSHYDPREEEEAAHKEGEEEEEEGGHEHKEESETGKSRETGEDPNEEERREKEERDEADARDAAGEAADRRDGDHDLATEEEQAVKYAEKQREMAEDEERTGEKWIGEAEREAAKVKLEMENERRSYERMREQEETEREHRMEMERRDKEEFEASQRLRENEKDDDEIDDSVSAGSGNVVATVYGVILVFVAALLL